LKPPNCWACIAPPFTKCGLPANCGSCGSVGAAKSPAPSWNGSSPRTSRWRRESASCVAVVRRVVSRRLPVLVPVKGHVMNENDVFHAICETLFEVKRYKPLAEARRHARSLLPDPEFRAYVTGVQDGLNK